MPSNTAANLLPSPPVSLLRDASLFIDFDGTLVELMDRPDAVVVDEPLRDLLGALGAALPGRVAIVTGRSVEQIDGFLGDLSRAFAVAGSHGSERRLASGELSPPLDMPDMGPVIQALGEFAASHAGTIVERKRYGVALHYRLAPEIEGKAQEVVEHLAQKFGFGVQTGKMMAELKILGGDKGQAVAAFLEQPSMAGTQPWFIGDDLTDEAGFMAAAGLGGGGVFVGPPRETAALFALPDVGAVRAWLTKAVRNLA